MSPTLSTYYLTAPRRFAALRKVTGKDLIGKACRVRDSFEYDHVGQIPGWHAGLLMKRKGEGVFRLCWCNVIDQRAVLSRSLLIVTAVLTLNCAAIWAQRPETSRDFNEYVAGFETKLAQRTHFFLLDAIVGSHARLKGGELLIEHIQPKQEPPGGMIHHWRGAIFVPGANLKASLEKLQDYDSQERHFGPEVIESRLIRHDGNNFLMRQRWKKTKVITVILETEHTVVYKPIDPKREESSSRSNWISEVKDPGSPNERLLPPGEGNGFLWRMNSYWRFLEEDRGLYVECDVVSLSRDLPPIVGRLIRPIVEELPEQSLRDTLMNVRKLIQGIANLASLERAWDGLQLTSRIH